MKEKTFQENIEVYRSHFLFQMSKTVEYFSLHEFTPAFLFEMSKTVEYFSLQEFTPAFLFQMSKTVESSAETSTGIFIEARTPNTIF